MPAFERDGLSLHFEQFGSRADVPVLLIHGIGCQLIEWPPSLVDALAAGGYRVITFDNRDAGLSSHFDHLDAITPDVMDVLAGDSGSLGDDMYSLSDMAADAVALLDYLGQSGAHIAGLSMGGAIAQRMAIEHAPRCFSMTCLMTFASSRAREEEMDTQTVMPFFAAAPGDDIESLAMQRRAGWDAVAGPHFVSSECGMGRFAKEAVMRAANRNGFARQLHAIRADGDRTEQLRTVDVPTLVIHGEVDPLVPISSGKAIASAIQGAEFEPIGHMGHDLPEPLVPSLAEHMLAHMDSIKVER